jgi:predicted ATPase
MKQFESFKLDASNECLWHHHAQISMAPKPFAVLRYLVDNPARLVTHDELMEALWPETYVQPQVLRTYVLELRKALGDDAAEPRFIETVPKRGYRFVAQVADLSGRTNGSQQKTVPHEQEPCRLVGRDKDLARLYEQALGLTGGQRQIVFVTGEAGIGKTALVDAFCQRIGTSLAATAVQGQCVEGLCLKEEYYPVMEALSQLCASPHGDTACKLLARFAPAWLPGQWREAGVEEAQFNARRMPGDLCAALEQLACERPLVLILEDIHWADTSTLELISALARRKAQTMLMVVATYRTPLESAAHPLRALKQDLLMHRLCTEIALEPLSRKGVKELLCLEMRQDRLPPELDRFVYRRSEGNPLFVVVMVEHLVARRVIAQGGANEAVRWDETSTLQELEAEVPEQLSQMIDLEIARLPAKQQRILEAASLVRVAFPSWAVAAALEEDIAEIEEACDQMAQQLHFLRSAGQDELPDGSRCAFYVFAHGLYREVLYRRQPEARRARGHARIADRLGVLFAGSEADVAQEIATHYEAAGKWQATIDTLRTAAQQAHKRSAYGQAVRLLEQALATTGNLHGPEKIADEIRLEIAAARNAMEGSGGRRRISTKA